MRLLILTQAVDQHDPVLGFFHQWVEEFARHCEKVYVVCLFEGTHALPPNVTVLSLGKEKTDGKTARSLLRAQYLYRFFLYVWKYRKNYDAVFVHMNQLYVVLGSVLWRLLGKRVCLWYAHGAVSFSLRFAEMGAHAIVTSTPEGFRLASDKVHVVGQGIDVQQFADCDESGSKEYRPDRIRIVYVGRISPVKHCETLIEAAAMLHARGDRFELWFVGDTSVPATRAYYESLTARIRVLGIEQWVTFAGGVDHSEVGKYLCAADVFVNPSVTGSLDKAGLEAIAAGVPVITCNEAFRAVLGRYAERLMFPPCNASALAARLLALHQSDDRKDMIDTLAAVVEKEHSLEGLIPRILTVLQTRLTNTPTHLV